MSKPALPNTRGDWNYFDWRHGFQSHYVKPFLKIDKYDSLAKMTDEAGPHMEVGLRGGIRRTGILLQDDGSGYGYQLLAGVEGIGPAPVESTITPLAAGGGIRRHYRPTESEIYLPIRYRSVFRGNIHAGADHLAEYAGADGSPVELVVKADSTDYQSRSKTVFYKSGLDTPTVYEQGYIAYGLTFDYVDPYWYGDEQSQTLRLGDPLKPFITAPTPAGSEAVPFIPVVLGNSALDGDATLDVSSQLPVYPTWIVTGPGADLRIETNGVVFELRGKIPDRVEITTDPRTGIDITGDGMTRGELWERVPLSSELAPLKPGRNKIRISMTGVEGPSSVTVRYRGRYLTPWRR